MSGLGAFEPTAEMRTIATITYQMFAAYVQAGFGTEQALQLTMAELAAARNSEGS